MKRLIVFYFFICGLFNVYSTNTVMTQKCDFQDNQILELLLQNYDQRIRPFAVNGTGPVIIKVNIMMRMLSKIDVVNMVGFLGLKSYFRRILLKTFFRNIACK